MSAEARAGTGPTIVGHLVFDRSGLMAPVWTRGDTHPTLLSRASGVVEILFPIIVEKGLQGPLIQM